MTPADNADASVPTPVFRRQATSADRQRVRAMVASTGFFTPEEVALAVELVDERLAKGPASGYEFVFAEIDGRTVGYACYGRIPATQASFDLYWIAVAASMQGTGIGGRLMREVERLVREEGATMLYIDTSGKAQYAPTRAFYEKSGFDQAAVLPDFFAPGDAKVIYVKAV